MKALPAWTNGWINRDGIGEDGCGFPLGSFDGEFSGRNADAPATTTQHSTESVWVIAPTLSPNNHNLPMSGRHCLFRCRPIRNRW